MIRVQINVPLPAGSPGLNAAAVATAICGTAARMAEAYPEFEEWEIESLAGRCRYNLRNALGQKKRAVLAIGPGAARLQVGMVVSVGYYDRDRTDPYILAAIGVANWAIALIFETGLWYQAEGNMHKDNLGVFAGVVGMDADPSTYVVKQTQTTELTGLHLFGDVIWPPSILFYNTLRIVVQPVYTAPVGTLPFGYYKIKECRVYFYDMKSEAQISFVDVADPGTTLDHIHFVDPISDTYVQHMTLGNPPPRPKSVLFLDEDSPGFLHLRSFSGGYASMLSVDLSLLVSEGKIAQHITTITSEVMTNPHIRDLILLSCNLSLPDRVRMLRTTDHLAWTFSSSDDKLYTTLLAAVATPSGDTVWTGSGGPFFGRQARPSLTLVRHKVGGVSTDSYGVKDRNEARTMSDNLWDDYVQRNVLWPAPIWEGALLDQPVDWPVDPYDQPDAPPYDGDPYPPPDWIAHDPPWPWTIPTLPEGTTWSSQTPPDWSTAPGSHEPQPEDWPTEPYLQDKGAKPSGTSGGQTLSGLIALYRIAGDGTVGAAVLAARASHIVSNDSSILRLTSVLDDFDSEIQQFVVDNWPVVDALDVPIDYGYAGPAFSPFWVCWEPGLHNLYGGFGTVPTWDNNGQGVARYAQYPFPSKNIEDGYPAVYVSLPVDQPNNVRTSGIEKASWIQDRAVLAASDPLLVMTETGRIVQAALRPRPICIPKREPRFVGGGTYPTPYWFRLSSQYPEWDGDDATPYAVDNSTINKVCWEVATKAISETVLIISSEDRSTFEVVPIGETFAGLTHLSWNSDRQIAITEPLPIPENVYQVIPVADKLLVLMDYRPNVLASPRPCLRCYSLAGVKLAEFLLLVDTTIQNEVYPSDVSSSWSGGSYKLYAGEAKWCFHGRPNLTTGNGRTIGQFSTGLGPRMKATWPGRTSAGALAPGDTIVHVSCECFEKKAYPPYDFRSRVEYRILKLGASTFEVLFAGADELTNHCNVDQGPQQTVQFSNLYPRPEVLINMAVGDGFFEYLIPQAADVTKWDVRRKSKS